MSSVYPLLGSLITMEGKLLQDSWLVIMFSIEMSKSCDDGNDPLLVIFEHVLLQLQISNKNQTPTVRSSSHTSLGDKGGKGG